MEYFKKQLDSLLRFRKELHQFPEVSGKEVQTAERICAFLEQFPPDELIKNLGGNGVAAVYKSGKSGKKVLLRAELDALSIEEINDFEHRSHYKSVSHKCGHDGHMAVLCGLAIELHYKRPETGDVMLLFQPAEEDGTGAQKVIQESAFLALQPDYVFALHNLPGFLLHQIVVKNNSFSCAVQSIIIKLKGKTSHAAEPEKGINPALAITQIINDFHQLIQSDIRQKDYCLITPIYIQMGKKAYGVSAGAGEIHFTVRTTTDTQMQIKEHLLEKIAQKIASEHQLLIETKWIQVFHATENNSEAADEIRKAAQKLTLDLNEIENPFSWGEDFGLFTQNYKGALFGIGAGLNIPALHNPDYDFPDEILPTAIRLFYQISKQITDAN